MKSALSGGCGEIPSMCFKSCAKLILRYVPHNLFEVLLIKSVLLAVTQHLTSVQYFNFVKYVKVTEYKAFILYFEVANKFMLLSQLIYSVNFLPENVARRIK